MTGDNGFYQNIFSSIIDGLILVSPEGAILHGNLAAEEMFRQSQDALRGKPIPELFPDQPKVQAKLHETFATGASFRDVECFGFRKSAEPRFPVSLTLSPYSVPGGALQGVVLHMRDRSLYQELEESSRQVDQISRLEVISLGMAHEIKNPLVAISGSAQLLRARLGDPEHQEYLDVVIREVERINRMVERLLSLADHRPPHLKPVNIHKILEEILLLEREAAPPRHTFLTLYDPSLPLILGDGDQLKQVFLNLIRNAREAQPKGGEILIRTRFRSDYSIKLPTHPTPQQAIVVEVEDHGVGISQENLKHLFTPFHTTKPKGNGLGLPISLKIVEDHNGKIKVFSREGQGTALQVFLPIPQGPL